MLSVIIPVYNEETTIEGFLNILCYGGKSEVIVVDGGSSDNTVELAKRYPVRVLQCRRSRAAQLNEGAKVAKGGVFLFLHADSILESGSCEAIEDCINTGHDGGCLTQRINSPKIIYRIIENSGNIRAKLCGVFYGDQAIFVKRDTFFRVGGFDNVDLFEDVIFSRRLKREGRTCILDKRVYTSARRWQKQGIIKATLINWFLTLGFLLGVPHPALKKIYADVR